MYIHQLKMRLFDRYLRFTTTRKHRHRRYIVDTSNLYLFVSKHVYHRHVLQYIYIYYVYIYLEPMELQF